MGWILPVEQSYLSLENVVTDGLPGTKNAEKFWPASVVTLSTSTSRESIRTTAHYRSEKLID